MPSVRSILHAAARNRCLTALVVATLASGCARPTGPSVLRIEAGRYQEAFDAAVDAARANHMPAELRDRRAGIIETQPRIAPSLLEPWTDDGSSFSRRVDQTIMLTRRRARFEFTRPGDDAAGVPAEPAPAEPDVVGIATEREDFTVLAPESALELRAWVFIEEAHTPGVRRNTWTRSATTLTRVFDQNDEPMPTIFWTPVTRDPDFERRLLAMVAEVMASGSDEATKPSAASAGRQAASSERSDEGGGNNGS